MTNGDNNDKTPSPPRNEPQKPGWERDVLERLAFSALIEQRRARRWGIFFKLFFAVYFLLVFLWMVGDGLGSRALSSRHTALVDLEGVISSDSNASADNVIAGLRGAFEDSSTIGVIVRANSPGGSPVQAAYIYDEIKRLRKDHPKTPLYAVVTDVCASGCYYALAGADKIYADPGSIVGSIGVLMNGFGFVDGMKKLGIERRLLTAGEHKGILDPFSPLSAVDKKYAQDLLNQVHRQFIERVRAGRGQHLKETKDIYSGLFWSGEDALKLGLIDEFGSASFVAREVIGAEEIVDYTQHEGLFDRFARRVGTTMTQMLSNEILGRAPNLR